MHQALHAWQGERHAAKQGGRDDSQPQDAIIISMEATIFMTMAARPDKCRTVNYISYTQSHDAVGVHAITILPHGLAVSMRHGK